MSEWISVKDRLPELHVDVLVYPPPTEYVLTAELRAPDVEWFYHQYEIGFGDAFYPTEPTHWMPLLPPPKD